MVVGAMFVVVEEAGLGSEEFDWLDVKAGFFFELAFQGLDGIFAEFKGAARPVITVELGRD